MNTDGNLAALAIYEKQQEENERYYEEFVEVVLAAGIFNSYEELRSEYMAIADQYDFEESFETFLQNNT